MLQVEKRMNRSNGVRSLDLRDGRSALKPLNHLCHRCSSRSTILFNECLLKLRHTGIRTTTSFNDGPHELSQEFLADITAARDYSLLTSVSFALLSPNSLPPPQICPVCFLLPSASPPPQGKWRELSMSSLQQRH